MKDDIHTKVAKLLKPDRQTAGQNMCRIDAHFQEECAHKKWAEKITSPPKPDIQTYIHTDGRTLAFVEYRRY